MSHPPMNIAFQNQHREIGHVHESNILNCHLDTHVNASEFGNRGCRVRCLTQHPHIRRIGDGHSRKQSSESHTGCTSPPRRRQTAPADIRYRPHRSSNDFHTGETRKPSNDAASPSPEERRNETRIMRCSSYSIVQQQQTNRQCKKNGLGDSVSSLNYPSKGPHWQRRSIDYENGFIGSVSSLNYPSRGPHWQRRSLVDADRQQSMGPSETCGDLPQEQPEVREDGTRIPRRHTATNTT